MGSPATTTGSFAEAAEDRIGSLATRAMNWANLRRKSNAEPWAWYFLGPGRKDW